MTLRAWLIAARPPTLLAAVAPVLVGGGLAHADGVFRWDAFVATLAAAVLINVAANFANDASDAVRGADSPARIGPPRAVAGGMLTSRQVWWGTAVVLVIAAALGVYLAWISTWLILAVGAASIVAMLGYTGGPWPYGYRGLGEIFVFVFFGLVAVVGSRYVHDATVTTEAWLLAIPVGLLATAILVANNVRDIDTDREAGKKTLAVRLGRPTARVLYAVLVLGPFAVIAAYVVLDLIGVWSLLALGAVPLAIAPVRTVSTRTDGPRLVSALKSTARLHALVGILLAVGVAV